VQTSELLHYAFRARDTEGLGHFYADVFEGRFFLHPVMTGLGIILVKLNHPEALFHGLLEFWPWDVVWDGAAARCSASLGGLTHLPAHGAEALFRAPPETVRLSSTIKFERGA
jgi:hypothetical protein